MIKMTVYGGCFVSDVSEIKGLKELRGYFKAMYSEKEEKNRTERLRIDTDGEKECGFKAMYSEKEEKNRIERLRIDTDDFKKLKNGFGKKPSKNAEEL
jgi:hypothetical protein